MNILDRARNLFKPVTDYMGARDDARKMKAWQRRRRDELAAAGSGASSFPKVGKRSRPRKPFAELTSELVKVDGKKKRVRRAVLAASDTTPNRHTFARFTNGKRRPRIRRLVNGHFEYLPQYK